MTRYATIVVDPPWPYPGGFKRSTASGRDHRVCPGALVRRALPYESMSVAEMSALPVRDLADPVGCRLFLWTTNAHLRVAFDLMEAWRFVYGQTLVWHKLGCTPWPTSVAPNSAEFILVGTVGAPGRQRSFPSAVIAHGVPKQHSRKPEIFLDWIEQVSPGPRVELFARRHRLGWDVWGHESANTVALGGAR